MRNLRQSQLSRLCLSSIRNPAVWNPTGLLPVEVGLGGNRGKVIPLVNNKDMTSCFSKDLGTNTTSTARANNNDIGIEFRIDRSIGLYEVEDGLCIVPVRQVDQINSVKV